MDVLVEEMMIMWHYMWDRASHLGFVLVLTYVLSRIGEWAVSRREIREVKEALKEITEAMRTQGDAQKLQEARNDKTDAILEKLTEQVAERKSWRPWR